MKNDIFKFELRHWLRSPLVYFLALVFFLFAWVTTIGTGGYFDGPIHTQEKLRFLNSAYSLSTISFLLAKFLLFAVALVAGDSLYRDYKNKVHSLVYAFPIEKGAYIFGKLFSALLIVCFLSLVTFSGLLIGEFMLGADNPYITDFSILSYVVSLGIYLVPSILFISIWVFVVVGYTRNVYAGIITVICMVLFQLIVGNVFHSHQKVFTILDPFGQHAFQLVTHDWGIDQQNTNSWPVNSWVILNRLFWFLISGALLLLFYNKFDFQQDGLASFRPKNKKEKVTQKKNGSSNESVEVNFTFTKSAKLSILGALAIKDFNRIIKSWMFWVLLIFGAVSVFFIQFRITNTGEFNLLPLTRIFIEAPLSIYSLIVMLTTFMFSGFLIHSAKQNRMASLIDVSPIDNWQLVVSKILALVGMQALMLLTFILIAVLIQLYNGYYHFEFGLYFTHLMYLTLPMLLVWVMTSIFFHSLSPNLFSGLLLLGLFWLGTQSLDQIGIHTSILKFNNMNPMMYSDFQGYGTQLKGYFLLLGYWLIAATGLLIFTLLVWQRGSIMTIGERWKVLTARWNKSIAGVLFLLIASFGGLGFTIYKAELASKNSHYANTDRNNWLQNYKIEWGKYEHMSLPQISDVELILDVYSEQNSFMLQGKYTLVNWTNQKIDTLLLRTGFDENTKLKLNDGDVLIKHDKRMKTYLYKLKNSVLPKDSLSFEFEVQSEQNRLFSRNSNVLSNGTYIQHDILPRLGYQFLNNEVNLEDTLSIMQNYFYQDAHEVNLTTTISTDDKEVGIAPGELISETELGTRRIYKYHTAHPIKLNFSFHVGEYEKRSTQFNKVNIEVYHHEKHGYNTDLMMSGFKDALAYNTKLFGEYPYKTLRIIEFPRTEESYTATLTSNNVPTSEILFNVNSEAMKDKIVLPYYVMAHELTHEWFGNQVMPAAVEGAKMLTESITEYITLCIYREYLGDEKANQFLDVQLKRYQQGRRRETGQEQPLYKVHTDQQYIAYGKGAIAFNSIAEELGRENLNKALIEYLEAFNNDDSAYPTSLDLIEIIKRHSSISQHEYIEKWLMTTDSLF